MHDMYMYHTYDESIIMLYCYGFVHVSPSFADATYTADRLTCSEDSALLP